MSATILVVEDEAIIAGDIKKALEGLGDLVPSAVASAQAALDSVVAHRPDLVLTDIRIQGEMDGIDAATLIGRRHRTPVVSLTSYSDDPTLARAKVTGAYGYQLEPFEDRDLRTTSEVALQERALEVRLSDRERWFTTTLKSIGDAVIATDVEQRITFMNVVAERITGWTSEEATGKQLGDVLRLIDKTTGAPLASPLEHVFQEGFAVELSAAVLSPKNGRKRSISDSAAPIVTDAGKTLGGVVVFRDVTDQRRLENRLAQSERLAAIGTLSAGMAHEINNPLTSTLVNVTYAIDALRAAKEKFEASPLDPADALGSRVADIAEALGDARVGIERVHRIVDALQKFGRLEKSDTSVVELSEVMETAVRMTQNVVRHHARLRRLYGTTPFVEASQNQLGQVFINLLMNAAQAMGEGGVDTKEIVVETHTDKAGRAVGEVRDMGPGIPQEILRRIFDPFFTTKPAGHGTGLGLSIAHSIVDSLGGEISVESHVGKGTTFRVALPPAKQRGPTNVSTTRTASARRGRILVIDDEPAIARVVGRVLQSEHDVVILTDAREALPRIAGGEDFDVVFCDLMMPGMTGMDFFDAVRTSNPELARRIVFITGGAFTPQTEEFLRTTSNAAMGKPFDAVALRRIVADYIGMG